MKLNDVPTARKLLATLAEVRTEHESQFVQSCYYNLDGAVSLGEGHAGAAVESQRRAAVFFPRYEAYLGLGDALAAKHDWSGAAQAYKEYLGFEGEIFHDDSPSDWVLAHLALARALAQAGDVGQSLIYYDQFLQLWSNADPDLADVRKARTEKQELGKTKHTS